MALHHAQTVIYSQIECAREMKEVHIDDIGVDEILASGPNRAEPTPAESVDLSPSQVKKLQSNDYRVSILFHYLQGTWTKLQLKGLKKRFDELGITIEGIYGSEFDADKQSRILEQIAQKDIDALISIPVDTAATAEAHRAVSEAGIDIVIMDNVPDGFQHPRDYAGCVSSDNKGAGVIAGRLLRKFVSEGTVGMVNFDAPFYVTKQREIAVRETLREAPDISIVTERGFTDPYDVEDLVTEMLESHPDLDGLFVIWADPPCMQAIRAARQLGISDLHITTTDLSNEAVQHIANGGMLKGTGAQLPYQQGIIEANMAGQTLLGNDTPQFIASGSLPISRENLREMYPRYYQEELPQNLLSIIH